MKLSVIIVNYNVKYFLEQCLHSVQKAMEHTLETEVFVVDNNSVDGSTEMLKGKFPWVNLIENKDNKGFSVANNQAIVKSDGQYVLLLNPDTIVEEDTFAKIIDFMDAHPDAGALGIKMLDGKGNFLPESKRGLPTPRVALFKMMGLSKLFPKSAFFNHYHLGHLDKDQTHQIEVVAGAFMLLRKEALNKVGLLDETFFMYGEDIDLSYRLTQAGYKNYYFPETRIIHYKGESTKKSSLNYVFVFYKAMVIFAKKHFSPNNAQLFSFFINLVIYFRGFVAIAYRLVNRFVLLLLDAGFLYAGMWFTKTFWEQNIKFIEGGHYTDGFTYLLMPSMVVIWITSVFLSGGYIKPVKNLKILQGLGVGTVVILVIYALLPEDWRSSRALIIINFIWASIYFLSSRSIFGLLKIHSFVGNSDRPKKIITVGYTDESNRVLSLLDQATLKYEMIGNISPDSTTPASQKEYLGNLKQLGEAAEIYRAEEVIFCAKDIPANIIIDQMAKLGSETIDYKIAPPESMHIIGSNSINTAGDLYVIEINSILKPENIRQKRMLDIAVCICLAGTLPLMLFIVKRPIQFMVNLIQVVIGKKSWVGYVNSNTAPEQSLPSIKTGILNPADRLKSTNISAENLSKLNILYAKDYAASNDLAIIWKGIHLLGR